MTPILGIMASGITKSKLVTGAYESIATVTTTAAAGSVTFSSIAQTYQSLQIRYTARRNDTGNFYLYMKPNGDTGATNKAYHELKGDGATASAVGVGSTGLIELARATSASDASNIFGVGIIDIQDYTNTTRNKTIRTFSGYDVNGSGEVWLASGFMVSTAALTSIEITGGGDPFAAGCVFALYGIKGA
jgi:hypothetical protein